MANLLGQNIGTNYKGILNLNTLNGNLSGTLQAVTDGDGNASPLQLSTDQVALLTSADGRGLSLINGSTTFFSVKQDGTSAKGELFLLDGGSAFFRLSKGNNAYYNGALFGIGLNSGISARLHVRGDGTNPVFRVESSAGANFVTINNSGQLVFGSSGANEPLIVNYNGTSTESGTGNALRIRQRANLNGTLMQYYAEGLFNNTTSGTNISHHFLSSGYAGAAGNGNYRATQIDYTINNSGAQTGTATGIFLNATETALSGMTHNLMDLGTGGGTYVSRFNVGRVHDAAFRFNSIPASVNWRPLCSISRIGTPGTASLFFGVGSGGSSASAFIASSNDELYLGTDTSNTFTTNIVLKANAVGFVGFGGLISTFPALKRNAAALDVRLADDTDFANLGAKEISASVGFFAPNSTEVRGNYIRGRSSTYMNFSSGTPGVVIDSSGASSASASAILQADSTTKGFLPPRMTTAQRDLITTPAEGLVIYNTTTKVLNFYNGTAWGAV